MSFDPRLLLLRRAAVTMAAVVASFLTLWVGGIPLGIGVTPAVLAAVLAITFSRSDSRPARGLSAQARRRVRVLRFASIPLISVAATGVAWLFRSAFPVGAAVFVVVLSLSVWVRRYGPVASRLGSVVSLPLMAVLVVPVRLPSTLSPWLALAAGVVAAVVAVGWVEIAQALARLTGLLPRPDADAAVRLDARADGMPDDVLDAAAQRGAGGGREGVSDAEDTDPAARGVGEDAAAGSGAATTSPEPRDARTTPRATPAAAEGGGRSTNAAAGAGRSTAPGAGGGGRASEPRRTPASNSTPASNRMPASTRMAVQLAVALTAAFVVGILVFPDHWGWVVLTAFIVCAGNRGRGDVVYKSILRVAGAIAGTVAAVALTESITASNTDFSHADGTLITLAVFTMLFFGLWLRDVNYAFWAAAVTVILTLVQGATGAAAGVTAGVTALTTGVTLGERVVAIVVGALCGVLASWFVLPVRTEAVVRRRLADALSELSTVVHPRSEPAERSAALERFSAELERLEQVARVVRVHRRFVAGLPGRRRGSEGGGGMGLVGGTVEGTGGGIGVSPRSSRVTHGTHQADLIDAVAGLEPLVSGFVALMAEGGHPVARARLRALARAVGEARRALASTPRADPVSGEAAPRGTAAALAAVGTVRALLVDDLVQA
ncbi:FUSC family protein [Subtercola endophyticus]|uniref:FUSC family protein n=1 Tax=Subtercola endophyticus TaxID=2895559 RepID=UPI001E2E8971|nr:FUSC family protein [Subtercola endophyticus]UFS58471.1 FUSC family protein [Subtercola endophyticus]